MFKFNPMLESSEASAFVEIEKFVDLVRRTADMPFHIELGSNERQIIVPRLLAQEFQSLTRFWTHYRIDYSYVPEVEVYWEACKLAGFIQDDHLADMVYDYSPSIHAHAFATNDVVRHIRLLANKKEFHRRVYDRRYQSKEKCQSVERFIHQALSRYSRSLVVRVDFGYVRAAQAAVTIDEVYGHINALCRSKQTEEAFQGLVGYCLAVEQGVKRGYHIHFVAIIDGNQYRNAWQRGTLFASLWRRIAGSKAAAYICKEGEPYYHSRGVGHFERDQAETHFGVTRAAQYLTQYKEDQYLRARPVGVRCFRKFLD